MHIRLVECLDKPHADDDREALAAALRAKGFDAEWVAWDDPAVDWQGGMSILRATWNYYRSPETYRAFLAWADSCEQRAPLFNPAATVRWNSHKGYLKDLEARGLPIVPTLLCRRDETYDSFEAAIGARGWRELVIKPAVSAGSFQARRFRIDEGGGEEAEAHWRTLLEGGDVLIQPFVRSVASRGEHSWVWIDGELTHAVRKNVRFHGEKEQVEMLTSPPEDEAALAEQVFAPWKGHLLYGRLDLVRDENDAPCIMELELIEPSLFLAEAGHALDALITAIGHRIQASVAPTATR